MVTVVVGAGEELKTGRAPLNSGYPEWNKNAYAVIPLSKNLLYGKPTTPSDYTQAVDGDVTTVGATVTVSGEDTEIVRVDYGKVVEGVVGARAGRWSSSEGIGTIQKLECSTDGSTWTTIAQTGVYGGTSEDISIIRGGPVEFRYVRVLQPAGSATFYGRVYEIWAFPAE